MQVDNLAIVRGGDPGGLDVSLYLPDFDIKPCQCRTGKLTLIVTACEDGFALRDLLLCVDNGILRGFRRIHRQRVA